MPSLLSLLAAVQRCPTSERAVDVLRSGLATLPANERAALSPLLLGFHRPRRLPPAALATTLATALSLPQWLVEASIAEANSPAEALLLLGSQATSSLDDVLPSVASPIAAHVAFRALADLGDDFALSIAAPTVAPFIPFSTLAWLPTPFSKIAAFPARPGPQITLVARSATPALWLDGTTLVQPPKAVATAVSAMVRRHGPFVLLAQPHVATSLSTLCIYDVLELGGTDLRSRPYGERLAALHELCEAMPLRGPLAAEEFFSASSWNELDILRHRSQVDRTGVLVGNADAPYHAQNARARWTRPPVALRAVLLFVDSTRTAGAPRGTWTLGLHLHSGYVPLGTVPAPVYAKHEGIASRITSLVHERFGPVRTLKPGIVVDATVEALQPNKRKTCGYDAHGLTLRAVHLDGDPRTIDTVERVVERFGADWIVTTVNDAPRPDL